MAPIYKKSGPKPKRDTYIVPSADEPQFVCGRCGRSWAIEFKHHVWSACRNCYRDRKQKDNKPEDLRRTHLQRRYGMTPHEVVQMALAQKGKCLICERALVLPNGSAQADRKSLAALDHDHSTGVVRGLLCNNCNLAVGLLSDDPALFRRAAEYLEAARSKSLMPGRAHIGIQLKSP